MGKHTTCILDDKISQIINEIILIVFIFIVLFLIVIIQFSKQCQCAKAIEGYKEVFSDMETKNLMIIKNNENERLRILKALESIAEHRPTFF